MKERPILFSAPMVRALLAGTKTQTRRVVKASHIASTHYGSEDRASILARDTYRCPYGQPSDRLWVRETFDPIPPQDPHYNGGRPIAIDYFATHGKDSHQWRIKDEDGMRRWKPSIHMPRWASRILLEVVSVRVERLQDISEADCIAEGAAGGHGAIPGYAYAATPLEHYRYVWKAINGPGSWDENPWVWVIEFKRVEGGAA